MDPGGVVGVSDETELADPIDKSGVMTGSVTILTEGKAAPAEAGFANVPLKLFRDERETVVAVERVLLEGTLEMMEAEEEATPDGGAEWAPGRGPN
jgi:hypothetical protein